MALEDGSDIELFRQASAGVERAFVALYRRWRERVYRVTLRIGGSASIAEDVTQEVFLTLVNGGIGFDPALGTFSSYVFGIARNKVLRRMMRERVFAPLGDDEELSRSAAMPGTGTDPLGDLTRKERIDDLHRAVDSLPLRYREVVVLCELQELSYAEAAGIIGCPEGTIRSRLHRARSLLLEKLREKSKKKDARAPRIEPARCLP